MSQWQSQIREHPVWSHLQALGPSLDQAASRDDIDGASLDLIERLRSIVAYTGKRLAAMDPALVPAQPLDALATQLQSAQAEVQNYASDGQVAHVTSASSSASEALIQLSRLPGITTPDDLTALSEAAAGYRTSMQQVVDQSRQGLADIKSEVAALAAKLTELGAEVSTQRTNATALTSDFQSQFSSAQEGRAKDFTEQQGARQKEFGETQTARQTRFDELHASFSQRLNDQDADFTRQRDALQAEAKDRLAALDLEYQASAKTILEGIQKHRSEVEKLVGVIGNLGVTSGYQKAAESARKATWFWQTFTMLGFAFVIGFAFYAFLPALQGEFSWERFAGRVVLTVAIGLFAAYSATQADRHMDAERRNRRLALELEAIGPYLAPLPEDKQQEFRMALGDRTFGREESSLRRRDKSPATLIDLVMKSKEFREFVTDLVKAGRQG